MKKNNRKFTSESGFSLVEALVSLAILSLLIGIILTGVTSAKQRFQVRDAAQQFANDLRQTILLTKNGSKVSGCTANVDIPRECSNYIITVRKDQGLNSYTKHVISSISNVDGTYSVDKDYLVGTYSLPGGVLFDVGDRTENNLFITFSGASFPFANIRQDGFSHRDTEDASSDPGRYAGDINRYTKVTLVSAADKNIKMNICAYQSGTVAIQTEECK